MEGWSDFYTLVGSTAATLIGLIFVVISLGADHASLLFSALAMMAPLSDMARALAVGLIGCAGLGYMVNLAFLVPNGIKGRGTSAHLVRDPAPCGLYRFPDDRRGLGACLEFSARNRRPCLRGAARCGASQLLDHDADHHQPTQLTK